MNFFKKALVASAVVATFGASAAVITPSTTLTQISKEGIAANIAVPDTGFDFNVKAEVLTPAASHIKVTFGADVDLTTPAATLVTNTTTSQTAGSSSRGDLDITFGTGSFTFDNLAIDTTTAGAHFVTFDVSIGQPIAAGAAFNVTFASGKVAAASVATYTATDSAVIDSGNGAISEEVDQFTFAVKTPLDGLIKRDDLTTYIDGVVDVLELSITNVPGLNRAITATGATALLSGNFTGVTTGVGEAVGSATTGLAPTTTPVTLPIEQEMLITLDGAAALAATNTVTVTTTHAAGDIPVTGDVNVLYTVAGNFTGGTKILNNKLNGGEWAIDATIINVPYLPVGFDGTNSTVILANEGALDTDVIVTAIDQNGMTYGPVNLNAGTGFAGGLPAQTVSKVSDAFLMDLLSAAAGTKLSVTFNIDANEGVVNGYAYTQKAGTGRSEVSSSQQRGN